ncbi:VWA domain-containing protein [Nannocystis sp.]|uniref:VWA domain-containing protein n=1 Tax=Nannocystis sp. TaxID=1962667 RepID=UPI0024290EB5|nr:VWA domain-containing protein [Nannocystis sp.]MBK7828910.1 VWA domain-containing protein [Nannocystis sp.]MBK9756619.1 VWA domain-containing protein [Nannocystis sp.]
MAAQSFSWRLWACLGLVCGCGPGAKVDPTEGTTGTETGTPDTEDLPTGDGTTLMMEGPNSVVIAENRAVDLLFVIDNSGSMGVAQARLSQAIGALVGVLEAPDTRADYRIGVTTTDSGNPRCPAATYKPEAGNLVLSSCVDRIDQAEFTFNSEDFSAACTDQCSKRDSDLSVLATATEVDQKQQPRKWVERIAGQLNVSGADAVEALQCYLPQGVAGCGFESHLESMYLALAAAMAKDSKNNYGFVRQAAQLAVVFVSDETDCSYNQGTKEIFTTNKVFWDDPVNDTAPTSGLCWRAGVACSGGPGVYSECHAENYDAAGSPGASDADAVLQPVSKYIDFLKAIEQQKQAIDEGQRVKVSLLTGVPPGYDMFAAEIGYEDSLDPEYQRNFGIGPGCLLGDPNLPGWGAVPPVRERELAEAFVDQPGEQRRLYSLCDADYSAALTEIGTEIAEAMAPACMPNCVRDTDPETAVLDPSCTLYEEHLLENTKVEIVPCVEMNGAWVPPNGATLCFAYLVDPNGASTPSGLDDMSPHCVLEGFNLEFSIVRTAAAPANTLISASCELSANKKLDCPKL